MQGNDDTECKVNSNRFGKIAIVIMVIVFIMNFFVSDCDLFWIFVSGGGSVVDYTSISYSSVFRKFQLFRLVTYGYTQTAVWHFVFNLCGLWYISRYLEKKIGTMRFIMVYHIGLIVAGIVLIMLYPSGPHYGTSPAIFACFGILTNWLLRNRKLWDDYKLQKGFYYLVYYFILSNVLGMCTLIFHFIGFAVGFLMGFAVKERTR